MGTEENELQTAQEMIDYGIFPDSQPLDDDYCKLPIIKAYRNSIYADYVLYDNSDPGKGMKFDWNKIKDDKPFFLAGGINISDIEKAKILNPYCIDVSSSVETDGYKDFEKMKEFIRGCRL